MSIKCLNELALAKLYKDTKDEKYLEIIDARIDSLYKEGKYETLSNEQLVLIIQKYNDESCWSLLYEKTEKSIHRIMNTFVHEYYRKNEYDDTFAVLKIGWVKSVNKYNITKATAGFVPFASTLMRQEFSNSIGYKRTKEKDGSSVITRPISTVQSNTGEIDNSDSSSAGAALNIMEDETSQDEMYRIELKDLMNRKLKVLKTYYPLSYEMLIKNIYQGKTQTEIAEEYNIKQSRVSRHITLGKRFLKTRITEEEYYSCYKK